MTRKIYYITSDQWWDTDIDIINQLKKEYRIEVFVLTPSYGHVKYPSKIIDGVHIADIRSGTALTRIFLLFSFLWFGLKMRANSNSICYFVLSGSSSFVSAAIKLLPRKRTIVCIHNYIEHSGKVIDAIRLKKVYRRFKYFHFHSQMQLECFKHDHPGKKAFATKMPLKDFGMPHNKLDSRRSCGRVFLFFGAIVPYKHLEVFIKAARKVASTDALFWIVGSCKEWGKYEALIGEDSRFKTDIRFVDNEEIPDIFSSADYIVLPYDNATQSGPSLTAVNYGLPIIGSRIKPFEELVEHGVNGFLFPPGDANALTEIINTCMLMTADQQNTIKGKQLEKKAEYQKMQDITLAFREFVQSNQL